MNLNRFVSEAEQYAEWCCSVPIHYYLSITLNEACHFVLQWVIDLDDHGIEHFLL